MDITPTPTDEEAAAIAAALAMTMLRPGMAESEQVSSRWRFSGRWWHRGHQLQRKRPSVR